MDCILGIDTSCYTTSVAIIDFDKNIVFNKQILLNVAEGKRGLKQSDAVFQHLKNLPEITRCISGLHSSWNIRAVCSSTKPRPVKDSYMPVFTVSTNVGQVIANILNVPFFETSHQECHIIAGQYSADGPYVNYFQGIHLSGGTSELLKIKATKNGYDIEKFGGTQDLNAGQFVDRIGVKMGLPFPSGPHLERMLAKPCREKLIIPSYVNGTTVSFSGAESHAQRLIIHGYAYEDIAYAVYNCILKTLEKWIINGKKITNINDFLLVGGVCSSVYIRNCLIKRLSRKDNKISLYFGSNELSKDNAVGTALIGLKKFELV